MSALATAICVSIVLALIRIMQLTLEERRKKGFSNIRLASDHGRGLPRETHPN